MEVHQHTHTAHKKWFHYFWEFFMMFLAISASFWVENMREHYIEKTRERQYMVSMLADLKRDAMHLRNRIMKNSSLIETGDTLFRLVRNYKNNEAGDLYRLFDAFAGFVYRARLADRTISQLRNAGGMRLIHVQAVSDSILIYEEQKKLLTDQGEGYRRENEVLTDLSRKLLDYRYLLTFNINDVPATQAFNPADLFEFSNEIKILKDQVGTYVDYLKDLLLLGNNLIILIQKEYHLK